MATPIEDHLRGEDPTEWTLVIRGRPLTVEGLLLAAGRTVSEFTWRGAPVAAVSAEVTGPGVWVTNIEMTGQFDPAQLTPL